MTPVLIIVPTYNEAQNVEPLLSAIKLAMAKSSHDYDVLFVDDHSPDGTAETIQRLRKHDSKIFLMEGNKQGLGKAYLRGLEHGLSLKKYEAVVMMDADMSHDPATIPALLAEIKHGADYVIGSRYAKGGGYANEYSKYRRLQSRLANFLARKLLGLKVPVRDLTGGFKAIRVSALRSVSLDEILATGYVFQVSLVYEFIKRGFTVREIPITFRARKFGTSKLGWRDSLEFLRLTYMLNPQADVPRFIRFALVGASGTVVNLGVLIALHGLLRINLDVAYLLALEVSIINNFIFNQSFTFQLRVDSTLSLVLRSRQLASRLIRYNLVSLGGAAISWAIFTVATRFAGLQYVLADIVAIAAATGWNYWLSVQYVWSQTNQPELQNDSQEI